MSSEFLSTEFVRTETELRRIVKRPPGTVVAKIDTGPLKANPTEFLTAARLALITGSAEDGLPEMATFGGEPGFSTIDADGSLVLPLSATNRDRADLGAWRGFAGALMVVPGVRYTLRVNGSASISSDGESLVLRPDQTYAHCAKALIRSALWETTSSPDQRPTPTSSSGRTVAIEDAAAQFIGAAPFVAIGTALVDGEADVSPRGDPGGFVQLVDDYTLFIPERPGNRIADSLRNIIANPVATVLFMIPGDARTVEVQGEANITTNTQLLQRAKVDGKVPKLGVLLTVDSVTMRVDGALDAADLWNPSSYAAEADLPTIGALVADPTRARTIVKRAMTGVANRATDMDYRRNLY